MSSQNRFSVCFSQQGSFNSYCYFLCSFFHFCPNVFFWFRNIFFTKLLDVIIFFIVFHSWCFAESFSVLSFHCGFLAGEDSSVKSNIFSQNSGYHNFVFVFVFVCILILLILYIFFPNSAQLDITSLSILYIHKFAFVFVFVYFVFVFVFVFVFSKFCISMALVKRDIFPE